MAVITLLANKAFFKTAYNVHMYMICHLLIHMTHTGKCIRRFGGI